MISFKSKFFNINCQYNQYFYKEDIKHLNYAVIICPKCGAMGFFHDHGKYDRYLFNCSDERFCIQRIRCEKYNSTHALLPDVIIPYRYFSAPFLLKVFTLFLIDKISIPQIAEMLKLILPNINSSAFRKSNDTINNKLKSVMDIIVTHPGIKRKDIVIILNKSVTTVSRYVKKLTAQGLVIKEGPNKTGGYVIISQKNQE